MKFAKRVLGVFGARVSGRIIRTATGIITARYLGPYNRGLWSLLVEFPASLQSVNNFGFSPAIVYSVKTNKKEVSTILSSFLWMAILTGSITVFLVLISNKIILTTILKGVQYQHLLIVTAICPFSLIILYFGSGLVSIDKIGTLNYLSILRGVFIFCGVFVILILFNAGLTGLVVVYTLIIIVTALIFIIIVNKNVKLNFKFNTRLIKKAIPFARKAYAINMTGYLHYNIDKFLIAYFLTPTQVAYYSIAVGLVALLFYLPDSAGFVLFPTLIDKAKGDMQELSSIVCRNVMFLTTSGAVIIFLFGHSIIDILYGKGYTPGFKAVPFLLPGIIFMSGYKILARYFMSINKHEILAVISAVCLVLNIVLNILFIPRYYILGAALSTTLSYSLSFVLVLFLFARTTGEKVRNIMIINSNDLYSYYFQIKSLFLKS